jgi:hypothetical protein
VALCAARIAKGWRREASRGIEQRDLASLRARTNATHAWTCRGGLVEPTKPLRSREYQLLRVKSVLPATRGPAPMARVMEPY